MLSAVFWKACPHLLRDAVRPGKERTHSEVPSETLENQLSRTSHSAGIGCEGCSPSDVLRRCVLDEAHMIRNKSTQAAKAAHAISASRRCHICAHHITRCLASPNAQSGFT